MEQIGPVVSDKKIFKEFPKKKLEALGRGHFGPGGHNWKESEIGLPIFL